MASCALACAPLVQVTPAHLSGLFQVRPCLDSRLFQRLDRKALMALALVVDASAERADKVKGAVFSQQGALQQIEVMCRIHRPEQKPLDTLAEMGILDFVPYLARQLVPAKQADAQPSMPPGAAYMNYVSMLNQTVMMSTQLYNDATNPAHHKYTAHQVALLYQALNMLQGETKPIRRLIEGRFDDIKAITESHTPYLDPELSSWLQGITWVCREEVTVCPSYVHRRLSPMLTCVTQQ